MSKNINCTMLLGSVCIGAFVAAGIAQAQEVKNASAAMARDRGDHAGLATAAQQRPQGRGQTSFTPTPITSRPVSIRTRRSTAATCGICIRPGSSPPRSRSRSRRRRSLLTASCTSPRHTATSTRSTPRPARKSGTTSPSSARSRPSAAARTIAASPSMTTGSMSAPSTRSSSRSTPRPAPSSGSNRSAIPRRATARRWRRPPRTAKS